MKFLASCCSDNRDVITTVIRGKKTLRWSKLTSWAFCLIENKATILFVAYCVTFGKWFASGAGDNKASVAPANVLDVLRHAAKDYVSINVPRTLLCSPHSQWKQIWRTAKKKEKMDWAFSLHDNTHIYMRSSCVGSPAVISYSTVTAVGFP